MKVPHRQRLEITLDLLKGCAHNCAGCMVQKGVGGELSDVPELLGLIKEMVDAGYVAFDLGLGPTDVMSSVNAEEVLQDPVVRELIQLFDQFTINAAFLDRQVPNYAKMCSLVDDSAPGMPIRFLIPAAPASFKNPRFGEGISERLTLVQGLLQNARLNEAGFVINCTVETMTGNVKEHLDTSFDVEFPVDKDDILNIPYGRGSDRGLMTAQAVKRVSHQISAFYSTLEGQDERRRNPDLCFDTGTMVNLLYTDGKLYWVPFLKDDCAFLDEAFVVPRPWSMQTLLTTRGEALERSVDYLKDTPCMECPYLSSCTEKGISSIMQRLSIKDCLVGLEHVR